MNPAKQLENIAKFQQMKLNARLAALDVATKLVTAPTFIDKSIPEHGANSVTVHTLLAVAQDVTDYILGNVEEESKQAMAEAEQKLNGPRIVKP